MRLLSPLSSEAAPTSVLVALRHLAEILPKTIQDNFNNVPFKILEAKLRPVKVFCNLIDRLLRVNEAAHAAGRILSHKPDRDLMRDDWKKYVKPQPIVERELSCGSPLAKTILEVEVRELLNESTVAGDETTLEKWTKFLTRLPSRFPGVSARAFLYSMGAVESAALRDMTMNGGDSFGGWWVVRCWVDEFLRWQAERGGFMQHVDNTVRYNKLNSGSSSDDDDNGPHDSGVSLHGNDNHNSVNVEME